MRFSLYMRLRFSLVYSRITKIFTWNTVACKPSANDYATLGAAPYIRAPVPFSVRDSSVNHIRMILNNVFVSSQLSLAGVIPVVFQPKVEEGEHLSLLVMRVCTLEPSFAMI